ncbi:hypothetical protein LTR54_017487 [Friedmanniomyces endolithicus]|uniref:Uncharacterized protein n=1 Tax=Friedmanniomyces endolithicus TaxID=329885 RepID=A0AAN6FGW3_9PEZI|nr:hypothetical protein LTS00_017383 [Friedmanniomyces endolithicus]KAK0316994.1 hypothetical protein LTR82_012136 [Friedmanniomyces endolithicus]KAK0972842.1 hypothetical protein LTR54_017487 [Friedmanniomyces endolithicus]
MATRKDMRREELTPHGDQSSDSGWTDHRIVVPYTEPEQQKDTNDVQGKFYAKHAQSLAPC